MTNLLMDWMWTLCVTSTVPALLVLLCGPILRRRFGAGLAYAAWLLVPITVLGAVFGSQTPDMADQAASLMPMIAVGAVVDGSGEQVTTAIPGLSYWLAAWIAGVLTCAIVFARMQRRFDAMLTDARPIGDNVFVGPTVDAGPALVGLLRPRILLPRDFDARYSAQQQQLILLHERIHWRRGDTIVNLAVALWQMLLWFNPIVHLAARRLRHDQELACDAAVLAAHPNSAKDYAEAMLSTQLTVLGLPVGCHWQSSHPLKERIIMLTQKKHAVVTRMFGASLLALSGLALAGAGIATQSGPAETFDVAPGYARMSPPKYPQSALDARIAGQVLLKVVIDETGKPATIDVESAPDESLGKAAAAAVEQWTFTAAMKDGRAVASVVHVPIDFSLDDAPAKPGTPAPDNTLDSIRIKGE